MTIETKFYIGDSVFCVLDTNKVAKGTVESITMTQRQRFGKWHDCYAVKFYGSDGEESSVFASDSVFATAGAAFGKGAPS